MDHLDPAFRHRPHHLRSISSHDEGLAFYSDDFYEDALVEDALVEDALVEDAPVEDALVEDALVEDAPVEDASAQWAAIPSERCRYRTDRASGFAQVFQTPCGTFRWRTSTSPEITEAGGDLLEVLGLVDNSVDASDDAGGATS